MSIKISLSLTRRYLTEHQLQRDTLIGIASTALRGIATVLSSYFIVRSLGIELLGAWSFLLLLTSQGYLGLIDLGLQAPVSRQMAFATNSGRHGVIQGLRHWYARRLSVHLLMATPCIALVFLLTSPTVVSSSMPPGLTILLLVGLLLTETALLPYFAQLEATSRFLVLRSLEVCQRILLLGFISLYVSNWPSLFAMFVSHLLTGSVVLILAIWVTKDKFTGVSKGSPDVHSECTSIADLRPPAKQIANSLAARVATTAQWQIGRTLVLAFVGIAVAGELEVITRFVAVLSLLMSALTSALLPRFVNADGSRDQLQSVFAITVKWFLFIVMPLTVFLILTTKEILALWFGEQYVLVTYPSRLMLLTQFLVGLGAVFDLVLVSINRNEYFAISRWIGVTFTLLLAVPLVLKFELIGLTFGLLGASAVSSVTSLMLLQHASGLVANLSLRLIFLPALIASGLFGCTYLPLKIMLGNSSILLIFLSITLGFSYILALLLTPSARPSFLGRSDELDHG